jgi:hypothetical protein
MQLLTNDLSLEPANIIFNRRLRLLNLLSFLHTLTRIDTSSGLLCSSKWWIDPYIRVLWKLARVSLVPLRWVRNAIWSDLVRKPNQVRRASIQSRGWLLHCILVHEALHRDCMGWSLTTRLLSRLTLLASFFLFCLLLATGRRVRLINCESPWLDGVTLELLRVHRLVVACHRSWILCVLALTLVVVLLTTAASSWQVALSTTLVNRGIIGLVLGTWVCTPVSV